MSQTLLVLAAFIIALGIGIFIGKILFSAKSQSEKSGLEERINGLLGQIEQLKIQFQTERNQLEKSFAQLSSEKENVQKEKESLAIHLAKKENDFDNLYPWSQIRTCNYDITTGKVKAWYGDASFKFDGTNGDVYTYIPETYIKIYQEIVESRISC